VSGALGGDSLTIKGKSFGVLDPTQDARLHMASGEYTCLKTSWTSDTSVVCVLPAAVETGVTLAITTNRNVLPMCCCVANVLLMCERLE
jgi:hypothetical protein